MRLSFKGGIHPLRERHEGKNASKGQPIRAYIPQSVCIPMDMHIGAPSAPVVAKGDRVKMGQVIATAVGGIGIPVHASVSGEVVAVSQKQLLGKNPSTCVEIRNDLQDEWTELTPLGEAETAPAERIIQAVRDAGICGMGGACFPTHAKMSLPEGKSVDTVILNGAECETFLTSDHRLMLEEPGRVVDGLRLIMRAMKVSRGFIAVEENKMDAVKAMQEAARGREGVSVVVLKTKYPQGGEKQLIEAVTGRQVPSGGLPMDAHVNVFNVGTAAAVADAVILGRPLVSRVTTVTGCVKEPANLLLRIGTPVQEAIDAAGGCSEEPGKVFLGGSMTGIAMPDTSMPMTKANNGIVVMGQKEAVVAPPTPCIRCARCLAACPIRLNPQRLKELCDQQDYAKAKKEHVMDCIVCGACSYVCPAKLELSPAFKEAKDKITARRI
ncbi:MAG: electron transport complex subunit RsxC [Clostridiales bacterium]|nr:electron transport complex subunit RsxC [Clostridiales bacterium]